MGTLKAVIFVAVFASIPFLVARLSRAPRGVRRGGRARHPFHVPGPWSWTSGAEDRSMFDDRDVDAQGRGND